jgi:hypothetical protein
MSCLPAANAVESKRRLNGPEPPNGPPSIDTDYSARSNSRAPRHGSTKDGPTEPPAALQAAPASRRLSSRPRDWERPRPLAEAGPLLARNKRLRARRQTAEAEVGRRQQRKTALTRIRLTNRLHRRSRTGRATASHCGRRSRKFSFSYPSADSETAGWFAPKRSDDLGSITHPRRADDCR